MYKLVNWIKREKFIDWEGAIIEDVKTGKLYITNGVGKWEARPERVATCTNVDSINREKFFDRWNKYFNVNNSCQIKY